MAGRFDLFKGKDEQYYFSLRAGNLERILQSEGYAAKIGATRGIAAVRTASQTDAAYSRLGSEESWYFVLKAGNGEILGRSETYTTQAAREKGIAAVKENAPDAELNDLT